MSDDKSKSVGIDTAFSLAHWQEQSDALGELFDMVPSGVSLAIEGRINWSGAAIGEVDGTILWQSGQIIIPRYFAANSANRFRY